ncbi:SRPBCC family protein [Streptomyces neyagawaensis]|uniref:SRPBCC family protein n=1 Tax=Streptomyces neyagawaensis TaxID=42238 RepID=UPI0006E22CEB|nr:SRPBCC family protein [Streptomyces neyagawaensis]MCL6736354.1 SRPBCC family protein [Streptomyces neyagawaensis]MDE1686022.1 SRPBCC family protein [Streptomyces neyagawaensis]
MAEGKGAKGGAGTLSKARDEAPHNPGTTRLKEELEEYIEARLAVMLEGAGHKIGEGARRIGEGHLTDGLASTASHAKGALMEKAKGAGGKAMDVAGKAKDAAGKAKDSAAGKKHGKSPEGGTGRGHTIIEDINVGVPVREAYNQWTQFQEFSRFAKGVVAVDQQDDTTTQWQVKVAKSKRRWRGNITEQVPDQRIAWTSEGEKATTKGVVTFHPLGENLTKVLLVMEYSPKGLFERTGGLFRSQGRRARLDLKLYRTFVMMRGEATGGWRGEIHDGEVTQPHESAEDEDTEPRDEEEGEDTEPRDEEEDEDTEAREEEDEDTEARDEKDEEDEDRAQEPDDEYEDEDEEAGEDEADDEYEDDEEDVDDEYEDEEPEDEEAEEEARSRAS